MKKIKTFYKILILLVFIVASPIVSVIFIPFVQTYVVEKISDFYSEKLKTKISVGAFETD